MSLHKQYNNTIHKYNLEKKHMWFLMDTRTEDCILSMQAGEQD